MKRLLTIMFLLFFLSVMSFASDISFDTSELSAEEIDEISISVTMLDEEPPKERIICFDVNGDGSYAIGTGTESVKTIVVYSSDNKFMYGFRFYANGSFAVIYQDDKINVLLVRSDLLIEINPNGEIMTITQISNTTDNNVRLSDLLNRSTIEINGRIYSVEDRKLLVVPEYAKLVVSDSYGKEKVLYETVDDEVSIEVFIVVFTFVAFVSVFIYGEYRKNHSREQTRGRLE